MQFYMPVKVFEEKECVRNHADVFAAFGDKALIVTGRHSAKANGAYEDVCKALEEKGIAHVLFDEVEENPSIETIMKARAFGVEEGVTFVIGIGGGSPLDAAKAIALMIVHADRGAEYLFENGDSRHLPLVLVPTTCGTGSEVTGVSVLTIHEKKTKSSIPHRIFGEYALIDGKYLAFAPKNVIRNTAVDALGHLWESFLNTDASDYSRMCVDAGLKLWSKCKDALLRSVEEDPSERSFTDQDYVNLMNASMFGGMSIAQDGTTLPHGLSYPLTYDLHMPHGAAIGYFQGGYMAEASEEDRTYMLKTAGFESLDEWQQFYEKVCGGIAVPNEELNRAVDLLAVKTEKLTKAPFPCDRDVLTRIAFWAKNRA